MWRLSSAAVRAKYLSDIGEEATPHKRGGATVAHKALAVPVTIIKGYELSSSQSCNRLDAADAFLSEQFSEAVSTEGLLILRGELLSSQHLVALGAGEALTMPWGVLVRYPSLVNHSIALETPLSVLLLVTWYADNLLVTWDKTLASYWLQAHLAAEALLMPLLALVLKLLHSSLEEATTPVTPGSKVVVMTVRAVQTLVLEGKGSVDQRALAVTTLEASLMPMLLLVRQVLGVGADGCLAGLAAIGEERLVTLDAEGFLITEDVTIPGEVQGTIKAREHRSRVLHRHLSELLLHPLFLL